MPLPIADLFIAFTKPYVKSLINVLTNQTKRIPFVRKRVYVPTAHQYNRVAIKWKHLRGKTIIEPLILDEKQAVELGANILSKSLLVASLVGLAYLKDRIQSAKTDEKIKAAFKQNNDKPALLNVDQDDQDSRTNENLNVRRLVFFILMADINTNELNVAATTSDSTKTESVINAAEKENVIEQPLPTSNEAVAPSANRGDGGYIEN